MLFSVVAPCWQSTRWYRCPLTTWIWSLSSVARSYIWFYLKCQVSCWLDLGSWATWAGTALCGSWTSLAVVHCKIILIEWHKKSSLQVLTFFHISEQLMFWSEAIYTSNGHKQTIWAATLLEIIFWILWPVMYDIFSLKVKPRQEALSVISV